MARQKSTSVTAESLILAFKQKTFLPLYLFAGEEQFLIDEVIDVLLDCALDQPSKSFNLDVLYGGEVDPKDVVALATSFPMMSERRVVIVRDAEKLVSNEERRDILTRYLSNPLTSTILVLIAPKADMRLAIFKTFQQHGVVVECKSLYENQIPEWVEKRVEQLGRSITPEASQLLQAHVGNSLREIQNEIDKLFIYVGHKKVIDPKDVSSVVGMSKLYNVFELQKTVGQGETARAMEILENMLDAGESPLGIIVMLTRFFQKLWILPALRRQGKSDYELASALQVSPYFVREYIAAAQRFPSARVEQSFAALLDADVTLKTTQESPKLVMTTMMYKLLRSVGEPVAS